MMNEELMTPAEIERATVERCAKVCDNVGVDPVEHYAEHCAAAIRTLPPMFGDVPAGWQDELCLVRAVLEGYPVSMARNDALRAVRAMIAAAPTSDVRGPEGWPMEEQPDGSVNPIDPADMGLTQTAGQAAAKDAAAVDKDSDGWIKWEGGECPVPDDTLVEVKFECGDSNRFLDASCWDWSHGDDTGYDIVSYRVLAAAPEVK